MDGPARLFDTAGSINVTSYLVRSSFKIRLNFPSAVGLFIRDMVVCKAFIPLEKEFQHTKICTRDDARMTSSLAGGEGVAQNLTKGGRLRGFGTDKGEGVREPDTFEDVI